MSDQGISNEDRQLAEIQAAYDLTFNLNQTANVGGTRATMVEVAGFAAMIGCAFLPVSPFVGGLALAAAFVKSALMRREHSMNLSSYFNDVSSALGDYPRSYLKELESDLKAVEDFSWDDINPVKQYERKNYGGLGVLAATVILIAPTLVPIALSMMATDIDRERARNTKAKTLEIANRINEQYGDKLVRPYDPQ